MKSKVTVNIAGSPYTLVTTEDSAYVEEVAAQVGQMMTAVMQQSRVSALDAAVLTAVNAVDSALKEQQVSESLRAQLKDELEEMTKVKNELAEARREIKRLKKSPK
ncbi:MAG TPA: cell division protein ZapA [Candidatus Onthomonas avicola]|nr:cell division protein ZapA [Candidatus Onthomonas avicola]